MFHPPCIVQCVGEEKIVKILMENNADPYVEDENSVTPILKAAFQGHTSIVEYFSENSGSSCG